VAFQWPITSSITLTCVTYFSLDALDYLSLQQLWYYFPNCVYPNPTCQLSLWEETGAPGENPRLSAERWPTLFTWVRSEKRAHNLRGERRLFWRLRHRSPLKPPKSPKTTEAPKGNFPLQSLCPRGRSEHYSTFSVVIYPVHFWSAWMLADTPWK
jgi:hypothetical protein